MNPTGFSWIFDLVIVAVLAFFAWRGAKKGLILTLFSLVALFVAFFGAQFVSAQFHKPVANIIEPAIYQSILGVDESGGEAESATSLPDLLDAVHDAGLYQGFSTFLDEAVNANEISRTDEPAQALAHYLALMIARAGLFAVTYLVILIAWFLVGRMLDLAFHLPILSTVNTVGGLVAGLVKAALMVFVLVWVGQLAGWVPAEPTTPVLKLFTPSGLTELLDRLVI
jgi:hypothetical protein